MKWYKSLPLMIAAGSALLGGCSGTTIQGKLMYGISRTEISRCNDKEPRESVYVIAIKDKDEFTRKYAIRGESRFLSQLEEEVRFGDEIILTGDDIKDVIRLKGYKVIKSKK